MKIGDIEIQLLDYGRFRMDGGALFGIVPRKLWTRAYPHADDDNRVELTAQGLLIRSGDRVIVADAGIGTKIGDKERAIFDVRQPDDPVSEALSRYGVTPDQVTDYIFTHLHFDHAGGATCAGAEGHVIPRFPNARHYVQQAQLDWARKPSMKDRASYNPDNWEPVVNAGLMQILDGESELLPGIRLLPVHGHTPGMQMILVTDAQSSNQSLLFSVDLFVTAAHLPPHYIAAYDNVPMTSLEEKQRYLEQAERENWIVVFGHDPFTAAAAVGRNARGAWELREVASI